MFSEEKRLQKQKERRGKRKSRGQGCRPKATEQVSAPRRDPRAGVPLLPHLGAKVRQIWTALVLSVVSS